MERPGPPRRGVQRVRCVLVWQVWNGVVRKVSEAYGVAGQAVLGESRFVGVRHGNAGKARLVQG